MAPSSASDSLPDVDISDVPTEYRREFLEIVSLTDGFTIDMRHAPREMQIAAYGNGLIPYIPSDQPDGDENSSPPK